FKTTDGGATCSGPQKRFPVNVLAIDPRSPGTLFAGTALISPILKTTDGGATWSEAHYGAEPPVVIYAMAIDPQNSSTVYAGALNGLFKSTDGGTNWSAPARTFGSITSLAIDRQNPSTVYAGGPNGLFKSTDGGTTWSAAGAGLPGNFANSLLIDP